MDHYGSERAEVQIRTAVDRVIRIRAGRRHRRVATFLALTATAVLSVAGCGGDDGSRSMSEGEVAARVDTACMKLNGYVVWLPEHLSKAAMSVDEGQAVVDRAADDFRSTLDSLDPPADLQGPVDDLAAPEATPKSKADLISDLEQHKSLYEKIGADRCAGGVQASILTLGGASVEGAYRKVGLPLPPHPAGW